MISAIITLKVPHNTPCIEPQKGDDTSSVLELSCIIPEEDIAHGYAKFTSDNKQVCKDKGCLFSGQDIHKTSTTTNNNNENTVRV